MKKDFLRRFLYYQLFPLVFQLNSKKPVKRNLVVFASDDSDELTDNMKPIYEEAKKRGLETAVLTRAVLKQGGITGQFKRLKFYIEFMKQYAIAGYVFLTDYFFPIYSCKPREETRVVQLWHACGAFKRFGYSCADKSWGMSADQLESFPIHNTYTDVFVSSGEIVSKYAQAFRCDEEIVRPLGVPRTDIYFDCNFVQQKYQEVRNRFPQIGERKILLYAPTFRGNKKECAYMAEEMDLRLMKAELEGEYAVLIKLHPVMSGRLSLEGLKGFAFDVTDDLRIEEALCAADIVITDYSSLIFEYALLKRPMIFFAYDLAEYETDRSFYYDYEQLVPGPIVKSTRQLVDVVKSGDGDYLKKTENFINKYMSSCDGKSTKRICEYLFDNDMTNKN